MGEEELLVVADEDIDEKIDVDVFTEEDEEVYGKEEVDGEFGTP